MSIIKFKVNGTPFTTIPNATLQDSSLTLEALGLLCHLLSRPGDWQVHKTQLKTVFGMGRDRLDRTFEQLVNAGYAEKVENREAGRYSHVDWIIHPSPFTEKPSTVKPSTVNQGLVNSTYKGKTTNQRPRQSKENTDHAALFERLWSFYPRKVNKKGAFDKFLIRIREGVPFDELLTATENYAKTCTGLEPRFMLHGATFFGPTRRWEDYRDGSVEATKKKTVFDELRDEITGGK